MKACLLLAVHTLVIFKKKKNWQARVTGVHQDYTECWKAGAKQVDMSPVLQSLSRDLRV